MQRGHAVAPADTLIAATALAAHAVAVVTRNTRHFADAGLPLVNPWL